ncbi:AzlC family ABC transporter permease [Granulicoccus phenolivorans]|uniref:AzlC family ABC transporter permease n=1 Tax=Granulicoccus phenolivorans TaxID=266854 RepID=UPI0006878D25|nr:AzlC family ABC transporter permease [Granulicoccus phenolivorans]
MPSPSTRLTPAVRSGLSISVAVGLYGISFGALAVAAGLSVAQACALSLLMFTGGSQFAFVGVLSGGGTLAAATSAASLLGVRNAIYGVQLSALSRPSPRLMPLQAHLTIDESMATATAQTDPAEIRRGFWTAGVGVYLLWNLFTLLGALAGEALGDPKVWGLDGAAAAAFLGLLWPRLKGREPIVVAVVCAFLTMLAVPFVPAGVPILIAGAGAVACWLLIERTHR